VLRNVLKYNSAFVVDSLIDMRKLPDMFRGLFVIVPYSMPETDIPSVEAVHPTPRVVTDMWVERCLAYKAFLDPDDHPASTPVGRFPINGFRDLKINSTGFEGIDLLHLSKLVRLGGATYDETLQPKISVLISNKIKANPEKQRYASSWGIPVVSDAWLSACLRSGRLQSFDTYTTLTFGRAEKDIGRAAKDVTTEKHSRDKPREQEDARNEEQGDKLPQDQYIEPDKPAIDEVTSERRKDSEQTQGRPGTDFLDNPSPPAGQQNRARGIEVRGHRQNAESRQRSSTMQPSPEPNLDDVLPLQEISNNSPPKFPVFSPTKKRRKPLFCSLDGNGSALSTAMSDDPAPVAPAPTSTGKTEYVPPQTDSINDAIQDLLNMTSKARGSAPPTSESVSKKTRLLGRALSSISNSSRQSRASSLDSVNTDGVGSIIGADPSQSGKSKGSIGRTGSFTGRAKAKATPKDEPPIDLIGADLCRDEFADEEPTPPMTQLGYGEHEDAVKIREKLAEKRRNRSRQGLETVPVVVEEKRIKDDEAILGAGWGAGRRTRHKERSPQGMAAF
jgi:DNA replication regulator DPB11